MIQRGALGHVDFFEALQGEEIMLMNTTSEEIFSLEPVTFRYKKEIDLAGTSQS